MSDHQYFCEAETCNRKPVKAIQQRRQRVTPSPKAWVVFTGKADLIWLRILKPGFRHCFLILFDGSRWISVDPLSNTMQVQVQNIKANFDYPLWLQEQGFRVLPANMQTPRTPAPFGIFSCVEAVKRVLGIHRISIVTPWQLYKFLSNQNKKEI